jgi:phosphatidyl-myo-inositol alpha-mannosyltransferase
VNRFAKPAARPRDMSPDQRHVLYVGRLEPRKGVEHLVQAMAAVQRDGRSARLVIVGDGPDRDGLEAAARRAGIAATFAGRVPDDALPGYYRAADVVCAPALGDESFGVVLLEAMAAGRPLVATRIAGYAELLEGRDLARLVDAGDATGLALEISSLLDDPGQARALAARAAARVWEYDWNAIASRLDGIYRGVIGAASGPSGLRDQLRLNELTVET